MIHLFVKFKTLFQCLLAASSLVIANPGFCSEPSSETTSCSFSRPLFEVKTAYFIFSDSKMRKIYDRGGLDVQLCASYPILNLINGWTLNAYGAVEYFHRTGKSVNGDQKTSLWSVPVNIGLKSDYEINADSQYTFAIGPRYLYLDQHNSSTYVYKNRSRNGLGFFVNTGFNYTLSDGWAIDIFGEYTWAKMHFHGGESNIYTRNIQVGGFTFGGGLGYEF